MPELTVRLTLLNSGGFHARPSADLVRAVGSFSSKVTATYRDMTVDVRSIIGLLLLAAPCGAELEFTAIGDDAPECLDAITQLVTIGLFPLDTECTLTKYIDATGDTSPAGLLAAAFSNHDLIYWYTRTEPMRPAREIAESLGPWAGPGPNRDQFVALLTSRLQEIPR